MDKYFRIVVKFVGIFSAFDMSSCWYNVVFKCLFGNELYNLKVGIKLCRMVYQNLKERCSYAKYEHDFAAAALNGDEVGNINHGDVLQRISLMIWVHKQELNSLNTFTKFFLVQENNLT